MENLPDQDTYRQGLVAMVRKFYAQYVILDVAGYYESQCLIIPKHEAVVAGLYADGQIRPDADPDELEELLDIAIDPLMN